MTIEENIKNAKDGVALIGEVIKAAGNNPQVKEAGQELGKTALTVTKAINNVLLPLAMLNFAFDKARKYYSEQFAIDMAQKAARIPPEEIIEPKASIAGPAIQGLAFCHEEPDLKEMYLNLLASAMDGRNANLAHPAFVEIIKQLNTTEAQLIGAILKSQTGLPIVELRLNTGVKGYHILLRHLLDLKSQSTQQSAEDEGMPAIVDNWIRLGLVTVTYQAQLLDEANYSWVESRPEYRRFWDTPHLDGESVVFQKGIIVKTAFGDQFAKAVGL
ncbi:DUF4393 domain-containing protein [Nitrosospira sp. Nsp13]|uniref:DUF4393 domain-containing protein n=1 Tax=Nitrosospira sp. Nsp13 TaxID=1855332 RepID=UPI00088924FA|nr:DUF4393 domain-containing protein [Nitrosospira sp. Nsp13]SCX76990.1 protein of unknown function [Nitrosospira sp. Nsp13]